MPKKKGLLDYVTTRNALIIGGCAIVAAIIPAIISTRNTRDRVPETATSREMSDTNTVTNPLDGIARSIADTNAAVQELNKKIGPLVNKGEHRSVANDREREERRRLQWLNKQLIDLETSQVYLPIHIDQMCRHGATYDEETFRMIIAGLREQVSEILAELEDLPGDFPVEAQSTYRLIVQGLKHRLHLYSKLEQSCAFTPEDCPMLEEVAEQYRLLMDALRRCEVLLAKYIRDP